MNLLKVSASDIGAGSGAWEFFLPGTAEAGVEPFGTACFPGVIWRDATRPCPLERGIGGGDLSPASRLALPFSIPASELMDTIETVRWCLWPDRLSEVATGEEGTTGDLALGGACGRESLKPVEGGRDEVARGLILPEDRPAGICKGDARGGIRAPKLFPRLKPLPVGELNSDDVGPFGPDFWETFLKVILHCSVSPAKTAGDSGKVTKTRMSLMVGGGGANMGKANWRFGFYFALLSVSFAKVLGRIFFWGWICLFLRDVVVKRLGVTGPFDSPMHACWIQGEESTEQRCAHKRWESMLPGRRRMSGTE